MIATDITRDKVRFSQTWNSLEDGRCFRVRIPIAIYLVNSIGISWVVRNELLSPRLDMKNILIRVQEVIPVSHAINTKRLRIEPCRHHAVIRLTGSPQRTETVVRWCLCHHARKAQNTFRFLAEVLSLAAYPLPATLKTTGLITHVTKQEKYLKMLEIQ